MSATRRARVDAVRAFNRFYTREVGALDEHLLRGPYSLTESRVLYELAQRDRATAADLARDLRLDAGYLSRILRRFTARRLIRQAPSTADGRRRLLRLTRAGRAAFRPLERRARVDVAARLDRLADAGQRRVTEAMATIERLLGGSDSGSDAGSGCGSADGPDAGSDDGAAAAPAYRLRSHRPGDMGWVIERHGALYAREWGYPPAFE